MRKGASNYTFDEATWTEGLTDWVGSYIRAFEYVHETPALVIPDNLRSGVSYSHLYEPGVNMTYAEMLSYYGAAALPTRVAAIPTFLKEKL